MKSLFTCLISLCLIIMIPWYSFSQGNEKSIGPVTFSESVFHLDHPVGSISFTLSALPSDETHRVTFGLFDVPWIGGKNYIYIDGGEVIQVTMDIYWAYFAPGETKSTYITVQVFPDNSTLDPILDEQGLFFSAEKPAALDQHKLSLIRDGYPGINVFVTQLSPSRGLYIETRDMVDLYFDASALIELSANYPVPTPCGVGCPQVTFGGMYGEGIIWTDDPYTYEITMDSNKEVTVIYYLSGTPTPTPTHTPVPTPTVVEHFIDYMFDVRAMLEDGTPLMVPVDYVLSLENGKVLTGTIITEGGWFFQCPFSVELSVDVQKVRDEIGVEFLYWKSYFQNYPEGEPTITANANINKTSPAARTAVFRGELVNHPGDVTNDGNINIIDALKVAQSYVGLNPENYNPYNADVDCDANVTIIDALLIAQYYVSLISEFC